MVELSLRAYRQIHESLEALVKSNRSHPPAFQSAAIAGIKGSLRLARAAAMRVQA